MKVTIENNELVIRIPVESPPRPSSNGKTLIVATSGGNQATSVIVEEQPVAIGLNAYIKRKVWLFGNSFAKKAINQSRYNRRGC